jgi:hypothetical protein
MFSAGINKDFKRKGLFAIFRFATEFQPSIFVRLSGRQG